MAIKAQTVRGESVQAAPRLVLLLDFDDDDAVARMIMQQPQKERPHHRFRIGRVFPKSVREL